MPVARPPRPLDRQPSVGLLFNPALSGLVHDDKDRFDHLAVIPDRAWIDHGRDRTPRFQDLSGPLAPVEQAAQELPIALHGIGLSILSAEFFDTAYLEQLARWRDRVGGEWVSEHLSFMRAGSGHGTHAAIALAMPYDHELLEMLVPRVRAAQEMLAVPFLLENAVSYVDYGDDEMTEPEFLNALAAETNCGVLLDLHNLYTNAHNGRCDALEYLACLDMDSVHEIHIAGGDSMMGLHTDSHAGPVHGEVWPLLEAVLPRASTLRAVTFEFHEGSWPMLYRDGVLEQLATARSLIEAAGNRQSIPGTRDVRV
jgi:uncharacterized protein (UPF0276 family)